MSGQWHNRPCVPCGAQAGIERIRGRAVFLGTNAHPIEMLCARGLIDDDWIAFALHLLRQPIRILTAREDTKLHGPAF